MVFGIDDALIAAIIAATATIGGGYLAGRNKKDKNKQLSTLIPEQEAWIKEFLGGGGKEQDFLNKIMSGDPEAFKNFEAPYLQQFQEEIIPNLTSQFGALGTGAGGTLGSSFQNALAQQGRNLQKDLAAMKNKYMFDAAQSLLGGKLTATGMKGFENIYQQGAPSGGGGAGQTLANILPGILQYLNSPGTSGGGGGNKYPLSGEYSGQLRSNPASFGY